MTSLPDQSLFSALLPAPKCAVLMATYNGAAYIAAQLKSLAAQTQTPDRIIISDDGSQDDTTRIIRNFARRHPHLNICLISGPGQGAAANFLSLLSHVPDDCDHIALCDQDDVWLPSKLATAKRALVAGNPARATLYCGQSWYCDARLGRWTLPRARQGENGFAHALVQNLAAGHTMVMNRAALRQVRIAAPAANGIALHDWWIYQIISGAGGRVIYDPIPRVLYRQHGGNLIGGNRGAKGRAKRLIRMLRGDYRDWVGAHLQALDQARHVLTQDNRAMLDGFAMARDGQLSDRLEVLRSYGIQRQGRMGQLALTCAMALRRA